MPAKLVAVVEQVNAAVALESMRVAELVRIPFASGHINPRVRVIAGPVLQIVRVRMADAIAPFLVAPEVIRLAIAEEHMIAARNLNHCRKRLALVRAEPV